MSGQKRERGEAMRNASVHRLPGSVLAVVAARAENQTALAVVCAVVAMEHGHRVCQQFTCPRMLFGDVGVHPQAETSVDIPTVAGVVRGAVAIDQHQQVRVWRDALVVVPRADLQPERRALIERQTTDVARLCVQRVPITALENGELHDVHSGLGHRVLLVKECHGARAGPLLCGNERITYHKTGISSRINVNIDIISIKCQYSACWRVEIAEE